MFFQEFYQYSQNLLLAQYNVAEIINHELTRGEVREDFLIQVLQAQFVPRPQFHKGTISDGQTDAGQIDIMLCRPHREIFQLGNQIMIRPDDCLCAIEVKGNARGNDLQRFDERAQRIKAMRAATFPLCGIFCYRIELQERTILNRFGFSFNAETQSYFDDEGRVIAYPNTDFFVSLDEACPLFLRQLENGRFTRIFEFPILRNVFQIIGSLIRTAATD
jgi:hypothetical protein